MEIGQDWSLLRLVCYAKLYLNQQSETDSKVKLTRKWNWQVPKLQTFSYMLPMFPLITICYYVQFQIQVLMHFTSSNHLIEIGHDWSLLRLVCYANLYWNQQSETDKKVPKLQTFSKTLPFSNTAAVNLHIYHDFLHSVINIWLKGNLPKILFC